MIPGCINKRNSTGLFRKNRNRNSRFLVDKCETRPAADATSRTRPEYIFIEDNRPYHHGVRPFRHREIALGSITGFFMHKPHSRFLPFFGTVVLRAPFSCICCRPRKTVTSRGRQNRPRIQQLNNPDEKKQGYCFCFCFVYIDQRGGTYSADVTAPDGTPLSPATATKKIVNAKNAATKKANKKAKAR